jgi:DNA-directed RNA polymerase beta' subunit
LFFKETVRILKKVCHNCGDIFVAEKASDKVNRTCNLCKYVNPFV